MKKSLVNKLVLPLTVLTGLSLGACAPTLSPKGKAFRDYMVHEATGEFIRGEVRSSQGHTDYQRRNDYQESRRKRKSLEPALLIYNKVVDLNNNKLIEAEELFGLGKNVFNLDEEKMIISLVGYQGKIIFRSWTDTGELIGKTVRYITDKKKYWGYSIGPKGSTEGDLNRSTEGDFLDNLKRAGPGNYIITVNTDDGKTYKKHIKIIGEKSTKDTEKLGI